MKPTEADIAKIVIDYLDGGEIYQEVAGHGGIADIVWVCGQILWVIEIKLTLSMSLLSQATNWVGRAHYVSVATPARSKKENDAAMQFLKWKGIGYLHVDIKGRYPTKQVCEIVKASLNRKARVDYLCNCLCEKQKTFAAAGNANRAAIMIAATSLFITCLLRNEKECEFAFPGGMCHDGRNSRYTH